MEPTTEQINALEKAHKQQFILLIRAAILLKVIYKKYNGDLTNPVLKAYAKAFSTSLSNWLYRNKQLEKSGVPKVNISLTDFFLHFNDAKALANSYLASGENKIGILPVIIALIWATVWIVGLLTAKELANHINTTADDKADLLAATSKACKDGNLSTEDCKKLLEQTQKEASSTGEGLVDTIKWGLAAVLAIFAIKQFSPK